MVEKKKRSETPIAKLWTPGTGESKQGQWSRVEREQVALQEEKVFVTIGKKKSSGRRGTSAVSSNESDDRAPKTDTESCSIFS